MIYNAEKIGFLYLNYSINRIKSKETSQSYMYRFNHRALPDLLNAYERCRHGNAHPLFWGGILPIRQRVGCFSMTSPQKLHITH